MPIGVPTVDKGIPTWDVLVISRTHMAQTGYGQYYDVVDIKPGHLYVQNDEFAKLQSVYWNNGTSCNIIKFSRQADINQIKGEAHEPV